MLHCNNMTTELSPLRPASPKLAPRAPPAVGGVSAAAMAEAEAVSRLSIQLFEQRVRSAALGFAALLQCRTPEDVLAAHAALVCEDLDLVREGCEGLSEIISRAAGDTVRSLPEAV